MIWQELPQHFLALAPMEGVTDTVFRQVVATAGRPDLFFTEFTNVNSYASDKGRANALERLRTVPSDYPIIAQIWGKDPEHFAQTAAILASLGFAGLDINMGCPDRHVNRAGGGAAMIRTPDLAIKCIELARTGATAGAGGATRGTPAELRQATTVGDVSRQDPRPPLPISVKTRLGYTSIDEYQDWLTLLLQQNLAALTIHLRTRKEMSKVPAHFELIPKILQLRSQIAPRTRIIINGDIKDRAAAEALWQQHPDIDGIMIGRGVFANPYCFTSHQPTREDLLELLQLHLTLHDQAATIAAEHGQRRAFDPLKRFFKVYLHGFPGAVELRTKLMECHTTAEVREILALQA